MTLPYEHAEVLALNLVSRGEGTHPVTGAPGVQDAVVRFPAEKRGSVEVALRDGGKTVHRFVFHFGAPDEEIPAAEPARKEPPLDVKLEELRGAVAANPEDAGAWNSLGSALFNAGRARESVGPLRKAVELAPKNPYYALELGLALSRDRNYAEVERVLESVVAADPKLEMWPSHPGVIAMVKLAHARWKLGNAAKAVATLRPTLPLVTGILRDLGAYAMDAGRHAEAVTFHSAAGSLDPSMEDALHGAGRSLLWLGRAKEAVPWLEKATRAKPSCDDAWYDLALAYARLGRRRDARGVLRWLLRRNPRHAPAWYELACLDALDRHRASAFRHLTRAARCGWNRVAHAQVDPDLAGLREDRRWAGVVEEMRKAGPPPR